VNTAIWKRGLQDHVRSIVGWTLGVVGLVVVQMMVYPTIRSSSEDWESLTDAFPEPIREMLRMEDYSTPSGYIATELLSFLLPFMVLALAASWGARAATDEEENGTADVLLSLPVSRGSVIAMKMAASATTLTLVLGSFGVSLGVGARLLDMDISLSRFVSTVVVLLLLGAMVGSTAAFVGSLTGRRTVALGAAVGLYTALFVLYSLAPLVGGIDRINPLNPVQWTLGATPLTTPFDPGYALACMVLTGIQCLAAAWFFARRDIAN